MDLFGNSRHSTKGEKAKSNKENQDGCSAIVGSPFPSTARHIRTKLTFFTCDLTG